MRKLREARHPRKNILFLRLRILNISAPPAQGGNAAPDRHPQALSADHADARAWPPGEDSCQHRADNLRYPKGLSPLSRRIWLL
jgi:hypothetical protein